MDQKCNEQQLLALIRNQADSAAAIQIALDVATKFLEHLQSEQEPQTAD